VSAPDQPYLSLVVPVYNGAARLGDALDELRLFLCAQPYAWELILVDDASQAPVREQLERFAHSIAGITVLHNETNHGKGYSVARGMLAARGSYRVFTDADLAYPATEVARILGALSDGADVAVACRVLRESRYVMSPSFFSYLYTRHLASRSLNAVVRLFLVPDVLDTQAGLKGFTAPAAEAVFTRLTIPRFAFDVEALLIAHRQRLAVRQVAVNFRYLDEPTTVRFVKDGMTVARDLARIWLNDRRGRYA